MGLDMYLEGRKRLWPDFKNPENTRKEDGFEIEAITLQLAYWRKHPDLHGYIVREFAGGVDECQPIPLDGPAIDKIIAAAERRHLTKTTGFFFGDSTQNGWNSEEGIIRTVDTLRKAKEWLEQKVENEIMRDIVYRASW